MAKTITLDPFPCVLAFRVEEYDDRIGQTESAGSSIVVTLNSKNTPDETFKAAVHEAVHVSQAVQKYTET